MTEALAEAATAVAPTVHLAENPGSPSQPFALLVTQAMGEGLQGRPRHVPLGKLLRELMEDGEPDEAYRLLTPLRAAAESVPWLQSMLDNKQIFQAMPLSADEAFDVLRSVPTLEAAGLHTRLPDWWKRRKAPGVSVTLGEEGGQVAADALLTFDASVAVGEHVLSEQELADLLEEARKGPGLVRFKGDWVEVDEDRLQAAVAQMSRLRREGQDGVSFVAGMRMLAGVDQLQDNALQWDGDGDDADRVWVQAVAGPAMRATLRKLRDPGRPDASQLQSLRADLRPYQREGVAWMRLLTGLGLGACLADDMGLGKTLQVLAALNADAAERRGASAADAGADAGARPTLLVVPASLLHNWEREARKFTPDLKVELFHPSVAGRQRMDAAEALAAKHPDASHAAFRGVDLVVTTYAMLVRLPWLADVHWHRVILDEAQAIKNPATHQTRAAKKLTADARIALTGTPVENRLADLWSLFDFLNPGLLGSRRQFQELCKRLTERPELAEAVGGEPVEGPADADSKPDLKAAYAPLRKLIQPYVLRRLKTDKSVIADLPDKIEQRTDCYLSKQQVKLYQKVVERLGRSLKEMQGIQRKGVVLQTLTQLKQICNHPDHFGGGQRWSTGASGKFEQLQELGERIADAGDRVLVFTQFREVMDPLADLLAGVFGRPGDMIHGSVNVAKRGQIVERFQSEGGPPFLILSLKAAGTGLNLTRAAQVVHFDRWWNPAVEDQATDRAFRIGQTRNVLVHKFVTLGTVEEKIDAIIRDKRTLADALLDGGGQGEAKLTELDDDALMQLVRLDAASAG